MNILNNLIRTLFAEQGVSYKHLFNALHDV